ncbi:heat shock protein [Cyclospora cayetanensis]|uniref:Heat shock protein n=1 Tax=Cyclospora cayetanensis TaxID=88456 RepID=A0A1D3D052_9EIME|nr:heat shock protein [Cyclospora cayetanensis]
MDPSLWTELVRKAYTTAQEICRQRGSPQVDPVHLFAALLQDPQQLPTQALKRAGTDVSLLHEHVETEIAKFPAQKPPPEVIGPNHACAAAFRQAKAIQLEMKDTHLAVDHLLLALCENRGIRQALQASGCDYKKLKEICAKLRGGARVITEGGDQNFDALTKYGVDFTDLAEQGKLDPVIGRDEEIRRVIRILCRRTKNNPVLIGEPGKESTLAHVTCGRLPLPTNALHAQTLPACVSLSAGVGKSAIVEGLARRVVEGDVPSSLHCRIISLDLGALISGAKGELRCIGATTLDEYRKHVEKDAAFERRFQQVHVHEPSVSATISILRGLKDRYAAHHGVRILDTALVEAAQLADRAEGNPPVRTVFRLGKGDRYITSRFLPDKAIDLMDEACAIARVQVDSKPEIMDRLERHIFQLGTSFSHPCIR